MSMLQAQCDELRAMAESVGLTVPQAATLMMEAADTIWQLRDDLQRANAENAKLREELADAPKCETCEAMLDCDECLRADGSHRERRRLSTENAKLRELIDDMYQCVCAGTCDECEMCNEEEWDGCLLQHHHGAFHDRMRELGVDDG